MAMDISNINNPEPVRKDSDKGTEKEVVVEAEKSVGIEKAQEQQSERQQEKSKAAWPGRVYNGDLYCDCEGGHKAMCLTVKYSKANKGRKYWRCRKDDTERCSFYIWDSELPTAKAWLAEHGPPPPLEPQTPQSKGKDITGENPWTLAKSSTKRKAKSISRELSAEDENAVPLGGRQENGLENGDTITVTPDPEIEELIVGDPNSPSRKASKRNRQDTPGKAYLEEQQVQHDAAESLPTPETARNPADSLPTPDTAKQTSQIPIPDPLQLREIAEASVRLGKVIDLTKEDTESDLTLAVLDELKSAKVELKASTRTYIGHLIDTEMALHDTRMKRARITIVKMKKRLDEMETALMLMTGMEDDDAVEL